MGTLCVKYLAARSQSFYRLIDSLHSQFTHSLQKRWWCCVRQGFLLLNQVNLKPKMAVHIESADDLKTKLGEAGDKLVVIDFMATWCGPCKKIGPELEKMAEEMADSLVVLKVDVDECEDIAMEYNINSMPTFVFLKNSKKLEEFSGANVDKLRATILKHK